jgi:DNA-binding transcriptional regulator YdaS (Cro superfamily)
MMTPLDRSIDVLGGVSALAALLGIAASGPSMWRARGRVPAEHCPSIERETRAAGNAVTCEELRPDVDWAVLRAGHVPSIDDSANPVYQNTAGLLVHPV